MDKSDILDRFIDDRIYSYGLPNTIVYLKDIGVSADELVDELAFDREDVMKVFMEDDNE